MIALTESQYAAIGRVAVESGTLERELEEYLERLGEDRKSMSKKGLSRKLKLLRKVLKKNPGAQRASVEFDFVLTKIEALICKRNTVVHGVWSSISNAPIVLGDVVAKGRKETMHARAVQSVAECLRRARKMLLRLCHDRCPVAVGNKTCPRSGYAALKQQFVTAC